MRTWLEFETDAGSVTSANVPPALLARWVSAPDPAQTKIFTPVTDESFFQATRRVLWLVVRAARPGDISTRLAEPIVKDGLTPLTPFTNASVDVAQKILTK